MDRNLTLPDIYQTATKPPRDGCVTNNRLERTVVALPYDYLVIAWFAIALISTAYVAYDQFAGNPEPTVVKATFLRESTALPLTHEVQVGFW